VNEITRRWRVNGGEREVRFAPLARLLDVLRDELDLISLKEGCGEGECGACTVLVDSELRLACLCAAAQIEDGTDLLTAEGLAEHELGRALQHAFSAGGAVQCGYGTPAMIVSSYALLRADPRPTAQKIREHLAGHLCRCTGYTKIVGSVQKAAGER
jgi:carbon-monoxide dehydrogenase small subunit